MKRPAAEAVGDHLYHGALQGQFAAGVDGDHHEAHVGDAGVGHQSLDVGLGERHDGAVDDADKTQHHGVGGKFGGRLGEQRQGEAQQAVGGGLQQDPRQVHGTRGRCLAVGIRQPAVQRYQRHLDREGDEEAQHQQPLHALAHRGVQQVLIVKGKHAGGGMVSQHQAQDGDQHDEAADLGVDEEFGGGVDPGFAVGDRVAPQRNQEVHRYQHHLPEEEEQEQVQRHEDAEHATQNPQQVEVEEADALHDFLPGTEDGQHADEAGEDHHQQRQAIHRQVQ